jgi:PadR family transcriptional regulator PadR
MGRERPKLLPGTRELLILKMSAEGPLHGYAVAQRLREVSNEVGESSLYPASRRLLLKGWAKASCGRSENNRRARSCTLTPARFEQLVEREAFDWLVFAIHQVLNTT